ncbi:anaerobic sulfatase maturase [Acidaminobacter sp. JC074]|uniref:anaerobic sulfatase maturase n=1 Tax=Acidaminobacter sp. JC074 TaxID=2530199 RepID=UPI001F0DBB1D|nr:anaerobic sulfatase maturase [Acidaminobacter sp. JC074]MCH4887609.1 anaerobic sulfatase maturase [Acidaminobacter sp. JC074]
MANLSLLIKPASSLCNLNCEYCFYHDVAAHRETASYGIMTLDTADKILEKAKAFVKEDGIVIAFQGGEPTLAGLDFFRAFVDKAKVYFNPHQLNFAIQTNGMVIDEDWAGFFKKHNFLVGVSLDGKKETHNLNRLDHNKDGSYKRVLEGIKMLEKHEVSFNILTVLNKPVARKIKSIYMDYKKKGFKYLQFIPCIEPFEGQSRFSLTPKEYEKLLKELFDLWYEDIIKGHPISIRLFDNYLSMLLGRPPESCDLNGHCSVQNVIEADGSVYPCDFYVLDEYKLGNVHTNTFEDMISSQVTQVFITPSLKRPNECDVCRYLPLCRNGCRRYRKDDKYYYCDALKGFFDYTILRFEHVVHMIRTGQI